MIDLFGPASGSIAHQVSKWLKGSNRILYSFMTLCEWKLYVMLLVVGKCAGKR